jgi:hypothetical protein
MVVSSGDGCSVQLYTVIVLSLVSAHTTVKIDQFFCKTKKNSRSYFQSLFWSMKLATKGGVLATIPDHPSVSSGCSEKPDMLFACGFCAIFNSLGY